MELLRVAKEFPPLLLLQLYFLLFQPLPLLHRLLLHLLQIRQLILEQVHLVIWLI